MTPAERMAAIFIGNPKAHCVADFTQATTDEKTGKVKVKYTTLDGPATVKDFEAHLRGDVCLLVIPVDQEGMCNFGVIDVDDYKTDEKKLAKAIKQHGLPLVMERSKSGGWHLVWYLRLAMLASAVRERLADFASTLGFTKVEIFPKQDRLAPGDCGNGINVSYFRGDAGETYAIDEEGNKLSSTAWLDRIDQMRLLALPEPRDQTGTEVAASILAKHWTHERHNLGLCALGAMLRPRSGVDVEQAQAVVDRVMELTGDEEAGDKLQRRTASYVADQLRAGKKMLGIPELRKRIGDGATDAFLKAIGKPSKDESGPVVVIERIPAEYLDTLPQPLTFAIDQLLPDATVGGLIAESGTGKTAFGIRLSMSVAMGRPVFGRDVTCGPVVYFALEDRAKPLWRRVHWIWTREVERMRREKRSQDEIDLVRELLGQNFYLVPAAGIEFHLLTMYQQTVRQTRLVDRIIERIPPGTRAVVIDPYARAHGCEENLNSVGTAAINVTERISDATGAALLLMHHVPKAAARERHEDHYSARGASGLADGARVVLRLMVADKKDCHDFADLDPEAITRGDICRLTVPKCNDFKKPPTLWLRRQGLDFEGWNPITDAAEGGKRAVRSLFDWWVGRERRPFTLQAVTDLRAEALGIESRDDARRILTSLRDQGVLVETERVKQSRWCALTFKEGYEPPPDL